MNTYQFYSKWLKDLEADQTSEGGIPHAIPDILTNHSQNHQHLKKGTDSAAAWADAAIIIPWTLYLVYGSTEILHQQYESMKKWIDFMKSHSKNYIWNYKLQFGDWVALDAEEGSCYGATPNDICCTAYCAYSTELFIKISKILGKKEDVKTYSKFYEKVVETYQKKFFKKDGHMTSQTQTSQIVSLYFNLTPKNFIPIVTKDLLKLIKKEKGHMVTGFIGTPYICHALSQNKQENEAYSLLLKEDFPSWLYQVKMGATTIWEHLDGINEKGEMWSPSMNSFNHYAYGSIGEWIHRVMIGLEIDEKNPGYKHFFIQPLVTNKIEWVEGKFESVYGSIESKWENIEKNIYCLTINIPANTTCTIQLKQAKKIVKTTIPFEEENKGYMAKTGSGRYSITFSV